MTLPTGDPYPAETTTLPPGYVIRYGEALAPEPETQRLTVEPTSQLTAAQQIRLAVIGHVVSKHAVSDPAAVLRVARPVAAWVETGEAP